jgi:thymidylate kinase
MEGFGNKQGQRGALIVVEGLDRAGKSSQCQFLVRNLQQLGHKVNYVRFPGEPIPLIAGFGRIFLMSLRSNNAHRHADR